MGSFMNSGAFSRIARAGVSLAIVLSPALLPREAAGQGPGNFSSSSANEEEIDDLLLSGRMELIHLHSFTGPIREGAKEKSRFYFNNIFFNLEGSLGPRTDFIIEYQPLISDLYSLGGFLTIAEALEGIGIDEADQRKVQIDSLITDKIRELDKASEKASFERAQISYFGDRFGITVGRVRNPFGFWDDFSLFRNLSALKTDPVSLGVALRRADLGLVVFGDAWSFSYELGVLQGANTFANEDIDISTQGFYIQGNYDLSDYVADGLRLNMFFETYDSDLLHIDLEEGLDYRFAGTFFQASAGLVYAFNRNIDLGAQILSGADEEGDPFFKTSIKIDAKF